MSNFDNRKWGFWLVTFVIAAEVAYAGFVFVMCAYAVTNSLVPVGSCAAVREDTFALLGGLLAAAIAIMLGQSSPPKE